MLRGQDVPGTVSGRSAFQWVRPLPTAGADWRWPASQSA